MIHGAIWAKGVYVEIFKQLITKKYVECAHDERDEGWRDMTASTDLEMKKIRKHSVKYLSQKIRLMWIEVRK